MKLRIQYIGSFEGSGDEGLSQLSKLFRNHFSSANKVNAVNTFDVFKPRSILNILCFNPQVIHYITGPTIRSFIILKILKLLLLGRVKTISSATRPFFKAYEKKWLKFLKPDLVLTQADKWRKTFEQNNIACAYLPNPVNREKFKKLEAHKGQLRKKYNLPLDKELFLHVGHIRTNRNLDFFLDLHKKLDSKKSQIVVVGSTRYSVEKKLYNDLEQANCIVINTYIKNIAEIYNACDYYVFPILGLEKENYPKNYNDVGVIDMPLSILEAMACEMPIISTEIDSLNILSKKSEEYPFFIFDSSDIASFKKGLDKFEKQKTKIDFTPIVKQIDQDVVFSELMNHYKSLLNA